MAEHREYRVLRSGGRGGREPGILVASTRSREYADGILDAFSPEGADFEVWMETRVVSDWERLDCPEHQTQDRDEAAKALYEVDVAESGNAFLFEPWDALSKRTKDLYRARASASGEQQSPYTLNDVRSMMED